MKFLIAGFGSIGRRHLRNLRELGEEDIVLYRTRRSTLPEDEIVDVPVETDLEAALKTRPDAVVIANPTALHLDVAIPAARAGSHLLLEKPVSHSLERMDELQAALEASGAHALVGFQFRFHPGLLKIHELLATGAVGKPVSARAHWGEYLPDWHPWENYRRSYSARPELGGGVVLTLSHPLDYLRWLLGEVTAVSALTGSLGDLDISVEDTAEIIMRFESGALGSIHLDYTRRAATHTLEITGTQGILSWNNATGVTRLFRSSTDAWESFLPPVGFDRNHLFLAEMLHFIQVVKGQAAPICTLVDGVRALELALAIHRSADTGRVVQV